LILEKVVQIKEGIYDEIDGCKEAYYLPSVLERREMDIKGAIEYFFTRWLGVVNVERGFTELVKKNGRDVYLKVVLKKSVEAKKGKDVKEVSDKLSRLAQQIIKEEKESIFSE